jgi:nitrite reductase/ring-hydroxylating ferredoxin subunit
MDSRRASVPPGQGYDTGLRRAELDPERARAIDTPWGMFALYLIQGEVLCAQAFCPHLEGPLFQGTLAGERITCPWHQWRFDLRTGQRVDLAGKILGKCETLARCRVRESERGTLVLEPPCGT